MCESVGWINKVVQNAESAGLRIMFIDALRGALENNNRTDFAVHQLFGVSLVCVERWDILVGRVQKTCELIAEILQLNILNSSTESFQAIINCHYTDKRNPKRSCHLCVFNKQLNSLESLLFLGTPTKRYEDSGEQQRTLEGTGGAKKISSLEIVIRMLRTIMLRCNEKYFSKQLIDASKQTENLFELFKTILQRGKDLYASCEDYAARTDELRQCKLRLEYANELIIKEYGSINNLPQNYIIEGTVDEMRRKHIEAVEKEKLSQNRLLAKLRYLSSIRQQQRRDCPVCLNQIQQCWFVLPCAHCICPTCFTDYSTCYNAMSDLSLLKCPVCRTVARRNAIAFVQNRCNSSKTLHFLDSPNVVVRGDTSVKLEAVIRRLLSINQRDPWAKTLVFTSLSSVIPVLCSLLAANNITYRNYSGHRQIILAEFRLNPHIRVLVMPISQGARGLNLTVANNIIFVEPQLDASQLAQAIGRIDRIGQTRPMMIHHFVVYGSIEEYIHYRITDPKNTEWTVGDLRKLLYTGAEYLGNAISHEESTSTSVNIEESQATSQNMTV